MRSALPLLPARSRWARWEPATGISKQTGQCHGTTRGFRRQRRKRRGRAWRVWVGWAVLRRLTRCLGLCSTWCPPVRLPRGGRALDATQARVVRVVLHRHCRPRRQQHPNHSRHARMVLPTLCSARSEWFHGFASVLGFAVRLSSGEDGQGERWRRSAPVCRAAHALSASRGPLSACVVQCAMEANRSDEIAARKGNVKGSDPL